MRNNGKHRHMRMAGCAQAEREHQINGGPKSGTYFMAVIFAGMAWIKNDDKRTVGAGESRRKRIRIISNRFSPHQA